MKNLIVILFLCLNSSIFAQSGFNLNLLAGVNYDYAEYTYNRGFGFSDPKAEVPLGQSIRLELEYALTENTAIAFGVDYTRRVYHPRLWLGGAYGSVLFNVNDTVYMQSPYLAEHRFDIISFPVNIKRYHKLGKRHALYGMIGATVAMQINEKETYRDQWFTEVAFSGNNSAEYFSDRKKGIALFSTALELGLGWQYTITEDWSLLVQTKANMLEYRQMNYKFKNNGELLWEDVILPIGQVSVNVGVQKSF